MLSALRNPVTGSAAAPPVPRAGRRAALLLAGLLAPLAAAVAPAASLVVLARFVSAAAGLLRNGPALAGGVPAVYAPLAAPSIAQVGGSLFFAANDVGHGRELWKSDGARQGTRLVSDIRPGPAGSSPSDLTPFEGALFFAADDGLHGTELWKSDGTPEGTTLVADINPASAEANARTGPEVGSAVSHLTVVGANLFFTANDGTHGNELWVYSGGAARLVKDIHNGADGSGPQWLMNFNGTLLFTANDGTHGLQLWQSDGTPMNTTTVQLTHPDGAAHLVWRSTLGGGLAVFTAGGLGGARLWPLAGSGAARVKNVKPADGSNPLWLTAAGNTLFFSADNGTRGRERWKAGAPHGGTVGVARLIPKAGGWPSSPHV